MISTWVMNFMRGGGTTAVNALMFNNPNSINNSMYIAMIPF